MAWHNVNKDQAERMMPRRNPADQAFDRWLQENLQRRHAAPSEEEIPAELLALALQTARDQG
jgi:ParB-like chromosome segregation protein Spo0J